MKNILNTFMLYMSLLFDYKALVNSIALHKRCGGLFFIY